jgi:hypothetical protein
MIDKKPLWWNSLLVILASLYLIPEAIFNSNLVSLIGLGTPTTENLERLELFGRTISGIGVTLLLADFLKTKWVSTKIKGIFTLLLLALIVCPTVFYAQKFMIENFIIQPSTGEDRQQAVFSTALRDALAINAIQINDVEYDQAQMQSSENLTFLSLFGGLLYADNNLSGKLGDTKEKIINKFIKQKAYGDFNKHYADYEVLYTELSGSYKSYANGSKKYNKVIADIPQREMKYWTEIEDSVNKGYKKYSKTQKSHIVKASARAQKYGRKIYTYFEKESGCIKSYKKNKERRKRCMDRLNQKYRTEIKKMGIGYIEPNYWLIVEDVSTTENLANTLLGGLLTGGLSLGLQAMNAVGGGDGGFKDKRYKYTEDPEHYRKKILLHPNYIKLFKDQTGYDFFLNNLSDFRLDKETQKRLIKEFKNKGLLLSNNWTINDRTGFYSAVSKKVKKEALIGWNKEVNKMGYTFAPNMSWNNFQLDKEVQSKIKDHMGDMYIKGIKADWNKKNFKKNVLDPNIERKTKFYLEAVNSSVIHFEDGGKYEDYGKQALRSVIVPPISMFLSLFLICLTLSKLPSKYYNLFTYNKEKKEKKKVFVILGKIIIPVLILVLPIMLVSNTYTDKEGSTVNHFLNKVNDTANPVFSYAIRWTLHAQPVLHPLGVNFEEYTSIFKNFSKHSHHMHKYDIKYDGVTEISKKDKLDHKLLIKGISELTIVAPEGSKIQIMNIKPKYKKNIRLTPKRYDIKVTKPSGIVVRNWYNIKAGVQILQIK